MGYRDKIVDIAKSQIGYTEGRNNATKYGDWYGLPNQPWCAMFVSWCAAQAGIPQTIIKKFASCTTGFNWFKSQGVATRNHIKPQKGDIIFFTWLHDGTPDHVGIVEYVDGDIVHTIEGNRSDKVARFTYNINKSEIYGYAMPKYGSDPVKKSINEIAKEVIEGKWGNGEDRKNRLRSAGYNPEEIQNRVNELLKGNKKSINEIAKEVIEGKWGNGQDRKNRLKNAGYNPTEIQNKVNELLR